jgi:hypothetical protein
VVEYALDGSAEDDVCRLVEAFEGALQ